MDGGDHQAEDTEWIPRFRVDEELEFFTDLAFHETERWIQAVTKKKLSHPDDLGRSLQNGVLLCELVNCLRPGSVTRINRLTTPIAGLDNLTLFLRACQQQFGLRQPQLFDTLDLEDLSQRAAFSDDDPFYVKQEADRRLRNVALTVYWLGQVAREVYSGPQLDQSAFSGLVTQNPAVLSPDRSPQRGGWKSDLSSSPYSAASLHSNNGDSSHGANSYSCSTYDSGSDRLSNYIGVLDEHAASEASFGSYEQASDGGLSVDGDRPESTDMSHRGSTSNLSRWTGGSSPYSNHDTNSAMYRSSPNLSHGSNSHARYSSSDSLDGGSGGLGGHSRQSSGSTENYATRRASATNRPNQAATALQFVKLPGSNPLAQAAQQQIKLAEESKKVKWDTLVETTEDNDWQSKLGNWKSKRRTRSAASYERKEEAEAVEKESEEKAQRSTKTFKEIVEERDRRKSMNSYPIEDENDEYTANNQSKDINHNRTESARSTLSTESMEDSSVFDSRPWAASSDDDTSYKTTPQLDSRVGNGVPSESDTESNKENWVEHDDSHNNNNNIKSVSDNYNSRSLSNKLSSQKQSDSSEPSQRRMSNKLSSIQRAFEEQAESDMDYKPLSRVKRSPVKYSTNNNQTETIEPPKVSPRSPRSDKDSVEKSITISQKPNSEKGFGFTFTGGRDIGQPAVVEKVSLGGAADVCELRVSDEITEVNRRKVATYTHTQIEDLIKRAVRTGKLELKVKRYIRPGAYLSDEFCEEDSFDRFEEQLAREQEMEDNRRRQSTEFTPMMDSLLRENHQDRDNKDDSRASWEGKEEEDGQDGEENENMTVDSAVAGDQDISMETAEMQRSSELSQDSIQREATPPCSPSLPEPVEESPVRPVVRTRKPADTAFPHLSSPHSPGFTPASVITAEAGQPISLDVRVPEAGDSPAVVRRETPSNGESPDTESSGFGPPKALLRWQRRPRSQYGESEDEQPKPKPSNHETFSVNFSQSATISQPPQPVQTEEEIRPTVVPRGRLDLSSELKKMEEWDKRQQQQRQPTSSPPGGSNSQEKKDFEENVQALSSRWQTDQQQATIRGQQKSQRDEEILGEERRRVEEMEEKRLERRAQRQAKMAQLAQQEKEQAAEQQQQAVPPVQTTERVIQLPGHNVQYGLLIDPANRPDSSLAQDQYPEVNFRVSLNSQTPAQGSRSPATAPVGRVSQSDLAAEYAAEQERLRATQEEAERRLREREEQIHRQEERLRQEEERLRLEQERLQREKQQHLQERVSSPGSLSKLSPSYPSSSPSSLSPQFSSQPEADQQYSSTVIIEKSAPNSYYVKSVQHTPYESPFISNTSANNNNNKPSERLTREDLMAMSRSARPLEEKPPSLQQPEPVDSPVKQQQAVLSPRKPASPSAPVVREAPSKQEKLSLNAVPKPRLQESAAWIDKRDAQRQSPPRQSPTRHSPQREAKESSRPVAPRPARRSDIMRQHFSSTQDHWLVQEAERRRLEEQNSQRMGNKQAQYRNGPIKPHESLTTNRWRDSGPAYRTNNPSKAKSNMRASTSFEQMRQKFTEPQSESHSIRPTNPALQPRAAPRLSSSSSHSRGDSAPSWQSHSTSPSFLSRNNQRGSESSLISPKPAPRSRTSPVAPGNSPEPTMAVSGRQRCSHCKEELGYGAAMVIESLNLHYHMQCFRCCVCRTQLGNGAEGADVRVRGWKLHCRNCYSNDEAGLKFSKV